MADSYTKKTGTASSSEFVLLLFVCSFIMFHSRHFFTHDPIKRKP